LKNEGNEGNERNEGNEKNEGNEGNEKFTPSFFSFISFFHSLILLITQWLEYLQNVQRAYSSGSVQDFHLIPFSALYLDKESATKIDAKIGVFFDNTTFFVGMQAISITKSVYIVSPFPA